MLGFSTFPMKAPVTEQVSPRTMSTIAHMKELTMAERLELEAFREMARNQKEPAVQQSSEREENNVFICQLCGDDNLADKDGVQCPNQNQTKKHFFCNSCLTLYVRSLNEAFSENISHEQKGRVTCPGWSFLDTECRILIF
jgi:hypothetical protein